MTPSNGVRRRLALGPVVLLTAALLAACGSTAAPPVAVKHDYHLTRTQRQAAQAVAATFATNGMPSAEAHCLGVQWVGNAGVPALVKSGVLTSKLGYNTKNTTKPTRPVVVAYADGYFACVNYGRMEAKKFDAVRPNVINDRLFAACANKIDKAQAKQALVADLLGASTKAAAAVQHELLVCAGE